MTCAELTFSISAREFSIGSNSFDSSNPKPTITAFNPNAMGSISKFGFFPSPFSIIPFTFSILNLHESLVELFQKL